MKQLRDLVGTQVTIWTNVSDKKFEGTINEVDTVQGWIELNDANIVKAIRLRDIAVYSYSDLDVLGKRALDTGDVV